MSRTHNLGRDSAGRQLLLSDRGDRFVLQRGAGHGLPQADIELSAEQMKALLQVAEAHALHSKGEIRCA